MKLAPVGVGELAERVLVSGAGAVKRVHHLYRPHPGSKVVARPVFDARGVSSGMTTTQRWVLALTSVASLMIALDSLVVTTALPTIRADLGASIEQLEWTVNAYI